MTVTPEQAEKALQAFKDTMWRYGEIPAMQAAISVALASQAQIGETQADPPPSSKPLRVTDAENAEAGARAVSDILEKLSGNMDAPLNAIDRLRAFAGGSKDIGFDTDDADEILEYLETLAVPSPQPRALGSAENEGSGK